MLFVTAAIVFGDVVSAPAARDLARGRTLFGRDCAGCHGALAAGGLGPDGAPRSRSTEDIWRLVAYVRSLGLKAPLSSVVLLRVTTLDDTTYVGRRMDEDTFSVRMLDGDRILRSFVRARVRSVERLRVDTGPPR